MTELEIKNQIELEFSRLIKKDIRTIMQGIVKSESIGVPLSNVRDLAICNHMLEFHPEKEAKIGCGIRHIFSQLDRYKNRCLWLERIDGTKTDWSWVCCLRNMPSSRNVKKAKPQCEIDIICAMRNEIKPQIEAFRVLNNGSGMHVDHMYPKTFKVLSDEFIKEFKVIPNKAVIPTIDGDMDGCRLIPHLAKSWFDWHKEKAVLRILTPKENMSKGCRRA